jgi:hypothetical protein
MLRSPITHFETFSCADCILYHTKRTQYIREHLLQSIVHDVHYKKEGLGLMCGIVLKIFDPPRTNDDPANFHVEHAPQRLRC